MGPSGPAGAPSRVGIFKLSTLNFEKLEICVILIAISHYIEAKFDYGFFIIFLRNGSKILHKKSQVISTKNEGVTAIFPNFDFILNRENLWYSFLKFSV